MNLTAAFFVARRVLGCFLFVNPFERQLVGILLFPPDKNIASREVQPTHSPSGSVLFYAIVRGPLP